MSGAASADQSFDVSVDCAATAGVNGQLTDLDIQAVRVGTLTADEIV